jgi:hypothetical protein
MKQQNSESVSLNTMQATVKRLRFLILVKRLHNLLQHAIPKFGVEKFIHQQL